MVKRTSPEEKARVERERRARERFGHREGEKEEPVEGDEPEGDFGPSSELARRRVIRDIKESNEGDE
jgi:hypothetical protein